MNSLDRGIELLNLQSQILNLQSHWVSAKPGLPRRSLGEGGSFGSGFFTFKDTKRSGFLPQGWHGGVESNTSAVQMRRER